MSKVLKIRTFGDSRGLALSKDVLADLGCVTGSFALEAA